MNAEAMLDALPERVILYRLEASRSFLRCGVGRQYQVEPAQAVGRSLDQFLNDDGLAGLISQLALLGPDNPVLVDRVARGGPHAPGHWVGGSTGT